MEPRPYQKAMVDALTAEDPIWSVDKHLGKVDYSSVEVRIMATQFSHWMRIYGMVMEAAMEGHPDHDLRISAGVFYAGTKGGRMSAYLGDYGTMTARDLGREAYEMRGDIIILDEAHFLKDDRAIITYTLRDDMKMPFTARMPKEDNREQRRQWARDLRRGNRWKR